MDTWSGENRYTHMCYSDLPYLYTGRGLAELHWPFSGDAQVRRALRRHGVPGRDLLLRVRRREGDPGARRLPGHRGAAASVGELAVRHPRRAARDPAVRDRPRPGVRRPRAAVGLAAGRGESRPSLGRGDVRAVAGAGAHLPDQLGHARGGARRRRTLVAWAEGDRADRRPDRARHRDQALPAVPARRPARHLRAGPAVARADRRRPGGRRHLVARQRAGVPHRTRAVDGVLELQLRAHRRPRQRLAGRQPGRGPGVHRAHDQRVVLRDLRGLVRGCRVAGTDRAHDAAVRAARLPRGRGLRARQQGLLTAVRPVAAAARGAGPPAVARPDHLAGRRGPLLRGGVVVPRRRPRGGRG